MNTSILCFGELLVDMISQNPGDISESKGFLKKFGGAPANTAIGLAKLGVSVSFMGKVGSDPFGRSLKETLEKSHVDTSLLLVSKKERTTLAFVSLTKKGERDFCFFRGAHETITPQEVDFKPHFSVLHFGSLLQTTIENRRATQRLIQQAQSAKAIISYDPNIRENLWDSLDELKKIILETARLVSILKVNTEEALFLSEEATIEKAAAKLFTKNLDALFITQGEKGCYFKTKKHEGKVATIRVKVVDTTGAGDAFNAGYLYARYSSNKRFSDMTTTEIQTYLKRANVIASLTTTKKGAISAFPTVSEVEKELKTL